jgi:hypothetical protein
VSSIFDTLSAGPESAEGSREVPGEDDPEVPGLDMSMLGRPLPQPTRRRTDVQTPLVTTEDSGEDIRHGDGQAETAAEADALAIYGVAESAVGEAGFGNDLGSPSFPDTTDRPFEKRLSGAPAEAESPAPPAMPPFLELPGMGSYADGSGPPPFLEPLERRPRQHVEEPEEPEPLEPPSHPEPIVSEVAEPPEPIVSVNTPPYAEPEVAAQPVIDAAAKIAAQANATAEALDNLKRFLDRDVPGPEPAGYAAEPQVDRYMSAPSHRYMPGLDQPARPPMRDTGPRTLMGDPAPLTINPRAPLMPLPVPPEASPGKSIYLLGFLTGIGLSVMAGLALYFLITMG